MLYTRNALNFRKFYKEEVAKEKYPIDLHFIGSTAPGSNDDGFSKLIYGNREDLGKLLGTIALNVAADDQAIYELIQNADDSKSTFFSVSYNKNYLLCMNNGNYFSDRDMSAIINVAGNYKEGEDIGTFGIGFKILHRLVGIDDGQEAIINDYAGPIIFSWNKFFHLDSFLNDAEIKVGFDKKKDSENPWLVKLLYTCFPSHLNEEIRLKDYDTRDVKFSINELNEMRFFLKKSLQNVNLTETNNLKNGSIFFLKLGEGKSKFLDDGIEKIKSGLSYSFQFLNSLKKIYINGEEIKAKEVSDYSNSLPINSKEFNEINPKNKNRDIKFTFAFYRDYKKAEELRNESIPNLYTFFSMDEEKNGFSFLLHCNAFDMNNDRRKLQANSQINEKLLPIIAHNIIEYSDKQKENNRNLFLALYANFLLSKSPKNKPHINDSFSKLIHQYVSKNIPTKNGYSNNAQNVKINNLKMQLDLADFGLGHIEWFEWDKEEDILLIEEAMKSEKIGIEKWDIRKIVEKANHESINEWIASCDKRTYETFLKELDSVSYLNNDVKKQICEIKLLKFSNNEYYSINELITEDNYGKPNFKFIDCFFSTNKTKRIRNELIKLGLVGSELIIEDYPKIFSSDVLPDDKNQYDLIANWCVENANKLSAEEKKNLFLNFINEETKFDNVAEGTLQNLELFCDRNGNIKPLNQLISNSQSTPTWLNTYKIKQEEDFPELNPYLIQEEDLFDKIILPNIEIIKDDLTEVKEIKELVTFFKENHRPFFNEYIIQKGTNSYEIIDKSDKFQTVPPNKETRIFIETHLSDSLIILPYVFSNFNAENGILKGEELHSLILDLVDVDEHKETLVSIAYYKEKKNLLLQKLSEIRLISNNLYQKESYEYKVLELACEVIQESEIQNFKEKIIIETENAELVLSEIPPFIDKFQIEGIELSLSQILPNNYKNSSVLSELIKHFNNLGLQKDKLEMLFGISKEQEPSNIYKMFSEQVETLENADQLAFIILYNKFIDKIDLKAFKAIGKGGGKYDLTYNFYTKQFIFLVDDAPLDDRYKGIKKILRELPYSITDENELLEEPYLLDDTFRCPDLIEDLSNEQKLSFIEFLFNQWSKDINKTKFQNIDWSKINNKETIDILGFNPTISVYPSEYACESEILPDYLVMWIEDSENKIQFLSDLGVWTESSIIVKLRKYLNDEIEDLNNNLLAQESRFNENETILFNSFEWLKEKEIKLKTEEQFQTFKKVVEVINETRFNSGDLVIIEKDFDFEELEENSTEWELINDFSIHLYEGTLPKNAILDEIQDYVFYRYSDGDFAINESKIYINEEADRNHILMQVATKLNDNDFTISLFGLQNNTNEIEKLRAEIQKLKEEKTNDIGKESENKPKEPAPSFLEEVNEFISDLERTEWKDYVPELKNILELSISHPKEKQKLFNLIAKIKLTKEWNIKFEDSDEEFNAVKIGNEKYFVHSARGAFAYIHPIEILKMRNEGYKMALDFNTKSPIKIYNTAEEILQLNTNHILAYQHEKTMTELFTFCEVNREANKHLLIIDKNNSGEKSRALLKLLNIEDDYQ